MSSIEAADGFSKSLCWRLCSLSYSPCRTGEFTVRVADPQLFSPAATVRVQAVSMQVMSSASEGSFTWSKRGVHAANASAAPQTFACVSPSCSLILFHQQLQQRCFSAHILLTMWLSLCLPITSPSTCCLQTSPNPNQCKAHSALCLPSHRERNPDGRRKCKTNSSIHSRKQRAPDDELMP